MILYNHEVEKSRIAFFLCCLVLSITITPLHAQKSSCENLGFELGDFTNWEGYNWVYSTTVPSATTNPAKVTLSTDRRQVIMTDTTAKDANTGNALRKIPKGYRYSARLGDAIISGDPNPRDWEQSLRYTLTVDSTNALLIVKFALVLQYASGHPADHEPRFKFTLYDQKGNVIPDCANYDVFASSGTVKGFQNFGTIRWRDWTTVGTNLLNYIGQTITIEFLAADCTERYHYGYAYFLAECHPLYITVKYCSGDSIASLKAPEGFEKYSWKNSSGAVVDTTQIYKVENPTEGATYSCTMTSATGCTVVLQSAIARYELKIDFTSSMIDCKSNIVQLNNLSSTNRGRLGYAWDFGDGKTYTERDPRHTLATSGRHQVSLVVAQSTFCLCRYTYKNYRVLFSTISGYFRGLHLLLGTWYLSQSLWRMELHVEQWI